MKISEFGAPVLRAVVAPVAADEDLAELIAEMRSMLLDKKLGVGLAAPQVGISKALSVIAIRKSKHRPGVAPFDLVIINPVITETKGYRKQLYEGCISGGPGKAGLFARVPRYKKIKLQYVNEQGEHRHEWFSDLPAHVIQHEVDHLNGILFVDRVTDTKSYKTFKEYLAYKAASRQA